MNIDVGEAFLKKEHLKRYQVVSQPGTYKVRVASSVYPDQLYGEGSQARYIVNLRCATEEGFKTCVQQLGSREFIPFRQVRDCFLSGVLWDNDIEDLDILPAKNEEVIAHFDYVEDVLRCTSLTLIPRRELPTFDLDAHCKSRQLFLKLLSNEKEIR